MAIPYEQTGRHRQKARTRDALLTAARELLASGTTPTVEEAAAEAAVSRTTAYRYFPNQQALLVAAHPEIDQVSLLPDDAPADVTERVDIVLRESIRIVREWEPQLRASLRVSLEPGTGPRPVLRRGRVIGWLEEALTALPPGGPDPHRLAVAMRAATGIEAFVWLVDVAGLPRDQAAEALRWAGHALLRSALADGLPEW